MNRRTYSNLKEVCSVIEMIKMLGLSRARFYQLIEQAVFPSPLYCTRTKRPFYTIELQELCINIRESNIGFNGQYVLFYSPRKKNAEMKKSRKSAAEPFNELAETLKRMGLDVTAAEVGCAVENLFPEGLDTTDQGIVLRDLFRHFKKEG